CEHSKASEKEIPPPHNHLQHTRLKRFEGNLQRPKGSKADGIEVAAHGKDQDEVSVEALRELVEEAPIVRLANLIICRGVQDGASDIHVEPGRAGVRVRYRVDGILQDAQMLPKKVQASLISRIKIMADMDIADKRCPQ